MKGFGTVVGTLLLVGAGAGGLACDGLLGIQVIAQDGGSSTSDASPEASGFVGQDASEGGNDAALPDSSDAANDADARDADDAGLPDSSDVASDAEAPDANAGDPGALDTTFGVGGSVTVPGGVGPHCLAIEPDSGAIVYAGGLSNEVLVGRLTAAGAPDTTFSVTGSLTIEQPGTEGLTETAVTSALVLLPGGGMAVDGYAYVPTGNHVMFEAQVTNSGDVVSTFGTNGVVQVPDDANLDSKASALVLQTDGKTILGGFQPWGTSAMVRLLTDGTDDSTFSAGLDGGASAANATSTYNIGENINQMALLSTGDVLAAVQANGFQVFRVTAQGQLDTKYGSNGVASEALPLMLASGAVDLVAFPDGAAVCLGSTGSTIELARFTPGGVLDPSFGDAGRASTSSAYTAMALARMLDGSFAVAVEDPEAYVGVARFTPDGTLDSTFGNGGFRMISDATSQAVSIAVDASGRIVIAVGSDNGDNILFARILP